ncbi:MAG: glycosyltransferase family 4 protein [Acidimicrobiales bacterium]
MRVALTHAYCWPDVRRGGERLLHELAGALARRGHVVTILSSASRPGRSAEDGVLVVRLRSPRGSGLAQELRFSRTVLGPLLGSRFDVVHSLGIGDASASIVASRAHRSRRTVFTHLGIPIRSWYEQQPDWRWQRFVAGHIDVYGCLSAHAGDTFEAGFGRRAARTPGGVRLARFAPAEHRAGPPTLLYSGALTEPRKRVGDLLEAVALLAATEPSLRLWLSGPGDASTLLAAAPPAARERTEVLPLGSPDLSATYGRAWVTVLPSVYEAFGLVLLESLACGTPVVAVDHSALPELVAPGIGELAAPEDPASLADACRRALRLAREPGIADRCRAAAEPHDWVLAVAPRIEALYEGA